ncbi:Ktr system potassium transporter B [Ammoniphilus oxalaticus]|uniref:Ktr system potassium transporter B n=1 Tax=Ammoniphilus oxalaticus TaxID=66863 RepID=A0A419SGC3_9BACL|nr:TrkH family potassium uptake protein [Ammoniphilus oxalaticus]RKD22829.1 Ktr system potassium transporter B [Ammoniphilus oxalaticus]
MREKKIRLIELEPSYILILGFGSLIAVGTLLFMLPFSTTDGQGLSFIDALFEATSAVCVTGLAVVDTGGTFNFFGQIILLVLIQVGGWGFMTTGVFMVILLGKKLSLKEQALLQSTLNQVTLQGAVTLVKRIIAITLIVECLAAFVLAVRWSFEMSVSQSIYYAVFHSISAFNNAGFGLESDNLIQWVGDPTINIIITSLFIIGGIGFTVIMDLLRTRSFKRLSLHSKLTLLLTLIINIMACSLIFFLEHNNPLTMESMGMSDQLWASYFQGVVTRTAGFSTVDIGQMTLSSQVLMMGLMFIGAGSASTGGGIKITTFGLIILAVWSFLSDKTHVSIFRRTISWDLVHKAFTITLTAVIFIFFIFFLFTITENLPMSDLLFEAISAFGTVGLSTGITAHLSFTGKFLISVLMFIGRVGPLTMAFALMSKTKSKVRYVEEKIMIG